MRLPVRMESFTSAPTVKCWRKNVSSQSVMTCSQRVQDAAVSIYIGLLTFVCLEDARVFRRQTVKHCISSYNMVALLIKIANQHWVSATLRLRKRESQNRNSCWNKDALRIYVEPTCILNCCKKLVISASNANDLCAKIFRDHLQKFLFHLRT